MFAKLHPTAYLQRRGLSWYFKLAIPRAIRHLYLTESGSPRTPHRRGPWLP